MSTLSRGIALILGLVCCALVGTAEQPPGQTLSDPMPGRSASLVPPPHFQEVLRLIRGHLEGVTEEELNEAMVEGLLRRFHPRVLLLAGEALPSQDQTGHPLGAPKVYEGKFGHIRVLAVSADLPRLLTTALADLRSSPQLEGLILDLRAAAGEDYRAAAATADLFVPAGKLLVHWDDQTFHSTDPGQPSPELPLVLLVNSETAGAAEALAGALHETGPVVILGSRTAGRAHAMRSFQLEGGQELRVAGAPVRVGWERSLAGGLVPDLEIASQPELERIWLDDPYHIPAGAPAAGTRSRPRFDEAELIRQHNGGQDQPEDPQRVATTAEPAPPSLQDPALVRALAVLTGVTRVRGGIRR